MGKRRQKEVRVEIDHTLVPLIPQSVEDECKLDVTSVKQVTAILPVAGVMQKQDGTLIPAVFVKIESLLSDGTSEEETLAFNPMALASTSNLLNAIALMLIADPAPVVQEIAEAAGLTTSAPVVKPRFNGYL